MKILITGAAGMLGRDLVAELAPIHTIQAVDLADGDLTDARAARELAHNFSPDWVINCAAYTAVDKAESEMDKALAVNATAVEHLALACRESGARLLQISTDYIFDGTKNSPYLPGDPPHPLGVYGRSKYEGELAVRRILGDQTAIVRTAWLYGPHGPNFVKAILQQVEANQPLRVVNDQFGSPTYTAHFAGALRAAVEAGLTGVYHATNAGTCSWHEFAQAICSLTGRSHYPIMAIASAALNRPAQRPANSRLDCSSFIIATGYSLPTWREGLREYLMRADNPPAAARSSASRL